MTSSLTITALKDEEYNVRNMAAWVSSKMTGQDFGGDPVRGREGGGERDCRVPVVGVSLFEKAKAAVAKSRDLFLKAKGIEACEVEGPQSFVVRAGSQAIEDEVASIHAYVVELRTSLLGKCSPSLG